MISLALYKILIRQAQWLLYIPLEFTFKILHPAHRVHVCVLYGSENKRRLFPYTTLTDCNPFLVQLMHVYSLLKQD